MDNLTHSLTGLLMGQAGLNRFHKRAPLILFLAANMPDCDAVSAIGGAGVYFLHHRWITHAIVMVPLVALLPALAVRILFWKQPFAWRPAWMISMAGVASHLALDFTNPYGIRLFLPFSDAWPALHATSVVDVWIWAVLLFATLWPMLSRLVGSEIGSRSKPGKGWAIAALLFLPLYNAGRSYLHGQAVATQMERVYNGQSARRAFAFPTRVNPMLWKGVVETNSQWVVQTVNLSIDTEPDDTRIFYKAEASPAIEAARQTRMVDTFLKFSPTPHWRVTPDPSVEGGTRVEVTDLRFGFIVTAVVDRQNRVERTDFAFR